MFASEHEMYLYTMITNTYVDAVLNIPQHRPKHPEQLFYIKSIPYMARINHRNTTSDSSLVQSDERV